MSKLLRRAKTKLSGAYHSYRNIAEDDAFADDCCYNLQQCIEFTLKYIVEMHGKKYVENHDIRAQLNILKKIGITLPKEKELRLYAVTLNSWEAESRYNDNFVSLEDDIQEIFQIASALVEFADSLAIQEDLQKIDVFDD